MTGGTDDPEAAITARLAAGDPAGAVTLALKAYGPEVYGYLRALHRDPDEADEVFARFAEAMWKSLPGRELRSSHRTWAYAVARRTSLDHRRAARRRAARFVPWPETSGISEVAAAVRTQTALHLQTAKRSRFAELRATLSEEDQTLLMLRVDRGLAWNDLAEVLAEGGDGEGDGEGDAPRSPRSPRSPEELRKESARLRKRFQVLKEKLAAMAREAGLVPGDGDDG